MSERNHPLGSSTPTQPQPQPQPPTPTPTEDTDQDHLSSPNKPSARLEQLCSRSQPSSSENSITPQLSLNSLGLAIHKLSLGASIINYISSQPHSLNPSIHSFLIRLSSDHPNQKIILLLPTNPPSPTLNLNQKSLHKLALAHILIIPTFQPVNHDQFFVSLAGAAGLINNDRILISSHHSNHDLNSFLQFHSPSQAPLIPATSIASQLDSPPNLRFPIYSLLNPHPSSITINRLNSHPQPGSTAHKLASLFASRSEPLHPITISARTLDASLDPLLLDQAISIALQNRIRDALGSLEEAMLDRISTFVAQLTANPSIDPLHAQSAHPGSLRTASIDQVSLALQDLYSSIDRDLEIEYRDQLSCPDSEPESRLIIDHTLELVEEVICLELYDRLFQHSALDDELSEKIARLNLADVSLDHLGLDLDRRQIDDPLSITTITTGLEEIISAASAELARLQDNECRSPRDKVGVCVAVHKLIVDGLSSLPPIPMKKEGVPPSALGGGPLALDEAEVELSNTFDRAGLPAATSHALADRSLPTASPLRRPDPQQPSQSDLLDAIETDLIEPPPAPPRSPDQAKPPCARPNSSSADLILPILIYLIIRANPNRLLSNLTFVNRFRYRRLIKGETDYCLVNFSVSCEFIKSFDGLFGLDSTSGSVRGTSKREATEEGSVGRRSRLGYGTFPASRTREKSGNEVEETLMAASRAVSGVLMGGYQKMISGGLLDPSTSKLPSGPRTLEDVKKLIGSGSGGRREGGLSGWSNRVGLLRRSTSSSEQPPSQESQQQVGQSPQGASGSAVRRLSSLFNTTNSAGSAQQVAPQDEDLRTSIGHRLSSLPGLGRLGAQSTVTKDLLSGSSTPKPTATMASVTSIHERMKSAPEHVVDDGLPRSEGFSRGGRSGGSEASQIGVGGCSTTSGPIERFERCADGGQLVVGDIPLLLADYQRLSQLGRQAGLW